jgi:aspartate kinase
MKFGGTSVEDAQAMTRTANIVRGRRERGLEAVVVVSAMAKVTDLLLSAAAAAGRGDKAGALAIGARLRHRHIDTAMALLEEERFTRLQAILHQEFDALDDLLRGIAAVGELTPRTNDLVVSFGERLSSRMMAEAFEQLGLRGAHVDARSCIVTDANYGKAVPQENAIEAKLAAIVLPLIEAGKTPVMGGFIGATVDGITTTLGRGGSDFTAALVD